MNQDHQIPMERTDESAEASEELFIVGIGASAGGLESLEKLFRNMPANSGLAFVVIQHLSPDFKSMMNELLARHTQIPIHLIEQGMAVKPNNIYLIPPKKEVVIADGLLHLSDKDRHQTLTLPIDHFFRSLAECCAERSAAVILSGTGSDGSRGIKAIHDAGGLVVCENPETAKFNGMPISAQDTGAVDIVLDAEEIPSALMEEFHSLKFSKNKRWKSSEPQPMAGIEAIFDLLRREYEIDFSHYKWATVSRRIERRLSLTDINNLELYVDRLRSDQEELNSLYKDLLIGVTKFFRDEEPFKYLENEVLPELIQSVPEHREIRVWCAGCATGEEVYTLAILLHEAFEKIGRAPNMKIFATDVHKSSLESGSLGRYDQDRLIQVTPARLERYFEKKDRKYQVIPEIRQSIVFAQHNVLKDAPFTNLDLVTCRNLLIYFRPAAQQRVISLFHFGLNTGGVLMLGSSESPGQLLREFETLDEHCKIYVKRRDMRLSGSHSLNPPHETRVRRGNRPVLPDSRQSPRPALGLIATYDKLLDEYMPTSLLVNENRVLLESFGGAERFLHFKGRRISTDILDLLKTDAKTSIAGALNRVMKHKEPVSFTGIRLMVDKQEQVFRISIKPIEQAKSGITHYLISLVQIDNMPSYTPPKLADADTQAMSRDQLDHLEDELRYTKENLQSMIEELETSNEEMQATNEELVASNEELQSTNEELQSVNEELYTVNSEHQKKIRELNELNQDMEHLLKSTDVATIFLDRDLRIRKFTPRVPEIFDLMDQDVGRTIASFTHQIRHKGLIQELKQVLHEEKPMEREVRTHQGGCYFMRILPYRDSEKVQGIVLTLIDISVLNKAREEVTMLSAIVNSSEDAIISTDLKGGICSWNEAAEKLFNCPSDQAIGTNITRLLPEKYREEVEQWYKELDHPLPLEPIECEYVTRDGKRVSVMLKFSLVYDSLKHVTGVSAISRDITELKKKTEQLREQVRQREQFLAMLSHELRNPLSAVQTAARVLNTSTWNQDLDTESRKVIDRQTAHMTRLLDDLLDVSRLTQNKIELMVTTLDLRRTVKDAVESIQSLADHHQIDIQIQLPEEPVIIEGDEVRLQQIQANLLVNAIKYSPPGRQVRIAVQVEGETAELQVVDEGLGIAPEMLERIFDMFVQAGDTLDRSQGGMGVGLTLVRRLVEMHGGIITATSDGIGKGSRFVVQLPLSTKKIMDNKADQEADFSTDHPVLKRVIVIEDQEDNRQMLKSLLTMYGYDVQCAATGLEGLEIMKQNPLDAAVIDIGLPEIDGYELAKRIRAEKQIGPIILIALTGYGQAQDIEKALQAGFDHHIVKPLQADRLMKILGRKPRQS